MSYFDTIPEPWRSRYLRASSWDEHDTRPPMMGGSEGQRFLTNGHWMALVDEPTWQACKAAGWRDVNASWIEYVGELESRPWEAVALADRETRVLAEAQGWPPNSPRRVTRLGEAWVEAKYAELLVELGATEVLVFAGMADHHRWVFAPGLALVSAMPGDAFEVPG